MLVKTRLHLRVAGSSGPRKLVPISRLGNRSETLARCAVVQPLRVYGTGNLLATALCGNFACGGFCQLLLYGFSEGSIAPVQYLRASGRRMARGARGATLLSFD
jgi:hypothetical protein